MATVFQLNDSDGEDFLDFDYPGNRNGGQPIGRGRGQLDDRDDDESVAAPATRGRGRPRGRAAATRASKLRPRSPSPPQENFYDNNDVTYAPSNPRLEAIERELGVGRVPVARFRDPHPAAQTAELTVSNNRKIPLKSVQEHQLLINQLNGYASSARFKPVLDECGIKIKDLGSKSMAELKELRERVRACCAASGGNGSLIGNMVLGTAGAMEGMAPRDLLHGYKSALEENPQTAALCEMIELDTGFRASMTPIQQMMLLMGTTAIDVARVNAPKAAVKTANQNLLNSLIAQRAAQAAAGMAPPPVPAPVAAEPQQSGPPVDPYRRTFS